MAVTTTFKQQCPSCEAMITIREGMVGKKVECTKCKDKFIAERPDDDDDEPQVKSSKKDTKLNGKKTTAVKAGAAPVNGKRPKVEAEEEDDEKPQTKAGRNGKSNGKHVKEADVEDDGDVDDEVDEKRSKKKKAKAAGGSNKLVIGLVLAVVGVAILAGAAFFVMSNNKGGGGGAPAPAGGGGGAPPMPGAGGPDKEKEKDDKKPGNNPGTKLPPPAVATPLSEAELARLSNLLPNDTEHVFHVFAKELFAATNPIREAAFDTKGALDDSALLPMLGFSVLAIDDMIVAERYSGTPWKYTVLHFKDVLQEAKVKTALHLESVKAIEGQAWYRMDKANPWFDQLARFSFGVPNNVRALEARPRDRSTYVRFHNAQTLIVGDEMPVRALLNAKGNFPLLSNRAPINPNPGGIGGNPGGIGGMPGGATGMIGGMPGGPPPGLSGNKGGPPPMPMVGISGGGPPPMPMGVSGGGPPPMPMGISSPPLGAKGGSGLPPPPPGPGGVSFNPEPENSLGAITATAGGRDVIRFSYQGNVPQPMTTQPPPVPMGGQVGGPPPAPMMGGMPGAAGMPGGVGMPGASGAGGMPGSGFAGMPGAAGASGGMPGMAGAAGFAGATGQPPPQSAPPNEMYLTIKPSLKEILDGMETRATDHKVLFSSATDMNAAKAGYGDKGNIARRPRPFWDVTLLITEQKPRIRNLGTALIQRDTLTYQLRNELTCFDETDASGIYDELFDRTSYQVKTFIKTLTNHDVKMPVVEKKEPPPPVPGTGGFPPMPGLGGPPPMPGLGGPPPMPGLGGPGSGGQPPKKEDEKPANVSQITVKHRPKGSTVEFILDLVLDAPTLAKAQDIASLTASIARAEMEAAWSASVRHTLANAGKLLGERGLSRHQVPPGLFPPGALKREGAVLITDKEPRNRVSWMAGLLPYMGHENLFSKIQFNQSWRDPGNWLAGNAVVPQFLDPSYPLHTRQVGVGDLPLDYGATHYVGIAGVGLDAATYKRGNPLRGPLSYEDSASLEEISNKRGTSNLILMAQVPHDTVTGVSPWMAGGGATLRGVPDKNSIAPFLSKNPVYYSKDGKTKQAGTYVVMVDGTVRFIDQSIEDHVFKAMCTIDPAAPNTAPKLDLNANAKTPLVPAPDKKDLPKPVEKKPVEKDPTPTKGDLELLQGDWVAKSGEEEGVAIPPQIALQAEVSFKGTKAILRLPGQPPQEDEFTIDQTKNPKQIVITDSKSKKPGYGIYELNGDNLRICIRDDKSTKGFPTAFSTAAKTELAMFVLTRKRAAPVEKAPNPPIKSGTRHQGEGRVYDKANGFSIVMPNGWKQAPAQGPMFLMAVGPMQNGFTPNLNAIADKYSGEPLEVVAQQGKTLLSKSVQNWKLLNEAKTTIDGKQAHVLTGSFTISGKNVTVSSYVLAGGNGKLFTVTFGTESSNFDAMRADLGKSASSIQVD